MDKSVERNEKKYERNTENIINWRSGYPTSKYNLTIIIKEMDE